jgi:adenylate kinase family enzyme
MTEVLALVTRFAAAAIEAALARRGVVEEYRAGDEVSRLVASLSAPSPVGFSSRGKAANACACLAAVVTKDPNAPLARVLEVIGPDRAAREVFLLLLAWAIEPRVGLLFGHVHDALQRTRPTLGACAEILAEPIAVATALEPGAPLRQTGIVDLDRWGPDGVLGVDARVVTFVATGKLPRLDSAAGSIATLSLAPSDLAAAVSFAPADVLVLCGSSGSGRTRAAAALGRHEQRPVLALRLSANDSATLAAPALAATAVRDARFLGARLLVQRLADALVAETLAAARDVPLVISMDAGAKVPRPLLARRIATHRIEPPSAQARAVLWAKLVARDAHDPAIIAVAQRYTFTEGTIRQAALQVPAVGLEQAARLHLPGDSDGLVFPRVAAQLSWERLILPDAALDSLRAVCAQARHGTKVGEEWGFARRHALGRGTKALFYGKPGTGKTLAADILATELDLPIFRVDLSRVVSKWIGETEQNLAKIFDQAAQSQAILFFDEADSLFSKRTAVQSSTDRYANMEVNYLLQRVEAHEGIVLLATNLKANMDDAFSRRLHYVVEFPEPDARARERIWRVSVPDEAPLHSDVDFAILARRFELPGGAIKSAVLGAAFLAAAEVSVIRQRHFAAALRREYAKLDRLYLKGELEALAAVGAA